MDPPLPLYVPILEEHWRRNSLYGLLEAAGRFNLCSAWEMSRLVDGWAERAFELRPPPQVANLAAFMAWAATCDVESIAPDRQALHIVMEVAQRDAREVGLGWLAPWLKWCPICADAQTHRAVHQHKATAYCPEHGVRLLTHCAYCALSSPYRVQRSSSLFQCAHCGHPINGGDGALATLFHRRESEKSAPSKSSCVRQRAEDVLIPGLPGYGQATASRVRLGSMAQDLRVLYGEQILEPRFRSGSSKVLGHYFRFTDRQPTETGVTSSPVDHDRSVLSGLRQAATLALLAGHSCVVDAASSEASDYRDCPCGVGFRLWLRRLGFDEYRASAQRCSSLKCDAYEASHLGLCLSLAWFASVQASYAGDAVIYQSLIQPLASWIGPTSVEDPMGRVATLAHQFQWFSIPCTHSSRRFLQRLGQLEATVRSPQSGGGSILDEIPWLMS